MGLEDLALVGWAWFEALKRSGKGNGEWVSWDATSRALCR